MIIYTPKGSMCANCKHQNRICSHLNFATMKVIEQLILENNELKIVRCTDFKRENHDNS